MKQLLQKEMPSPEWIVKDHDQKLLSDCLPVSLPLNRQNEKILQKMIDWVRLSQDENIGKQLELVEAIGIAAPQIGFNLAMYYILLPIWDEKNQKFILLEHALVNPKITAYSQQKAALSTGEGCLSVNKKHEGYVPRSYKIQVSGYDYLKKTNVNLTVRDYEAIVFQHEQDHLEHKLYYHHINEKTPWYTDNNWIIIGKNHN